MKYYEGDGMINTAINKLPFEMHIPTYNFCGPGTKLKKRLSRGDRGINGLDEACREHDIAYMLNKDLEQRHKADESLAHSAMSRFHSKDATVGEKIAALGVAGVMKAKVKMGMGYSKSGLTKRNYNQVINKCTKVVEKVKKTISTLLTNVDKSLKDLEGIKISQNITSRKVTIKRRQSMKKTKPPMELSTPDIQKQQIVNRLRERVKRRLEFDPGTPETQNIPAKKLRLNFEDTQTPRQNPPAPLRKRKLYFSNEIEEAPSITDTPRPKLLARKRKINFNDEDNNFEDIKKRRIDDNNLTL